MHKCVGTTLLLLFFLPLMAQSTQVKKVLAAQNNLKLYAADQKVPLKESLRKIEDRFHINILYRTEQVRNKYVSGINNLSDNVDTELEQLLASLNMTFEQVSTRTYIVLDKEKPAIEQTMLELISGTVVDAETDETLPGVNIMVKGTTTGTSTDSDGSFELNVSSLQDTLIASFVGYQTQEIPMQGQSKFNIELQPQAIAGEEIVVVGYGEQRKVNLTGATATVDEDDLNKRKVSNPSTMLQGVLPGLQVVQNSGTPGGDVSMLVRGFGTFSGAGVNPLVLIDGVPGELSDVNPNDIENATLLKDAASAAIYGSRAANGVILINTKKGKEGQLSLKYDFNIGQHSPTVLPDLITNSVEYMELYNEAALNSPGASPIYSQEEIDAYRNSNDESLYPNFDWLDFMVNPAYVQNHHLSLNGGSDRTTYNIGLGYVDQPGTIKSFDYDKYNVQMNLSSHATDRIDLGLNTGLNYDVTNNIDQIWPLYENILASGPTYAPTLPDGRYARNAFEKEVNANRFQTNPYARVQEESVQRTGWRMQVNAYIDVTLVEGLVWKTKGGVNLSNSKTKRFDGKFGAYNYHSGSLSRYENTNSLNISQFNDIRPVLFSHLTYDQDLGDHHFKVLGGFQLESYKYEQTGLGRDSYLTNTAQEIDAGPVASQHTSGTSQEWTMLSGFGRVNYDFKNKYLLEANLRADASSRFPPGNRWGYFPSFSVGWRLSEEAFLDDVSWLNEFKLRGSYGMLGNQEIGYYPYQSVLNIGSGVGVYPLDGEVVTTVTPSALVNRNIKWETTTVTDIGFDMATLNNRLNITFDWFEKVTDGILRQAQIPAYIGLAPPTINNGSLKNTGFEFDVSYTDHIGEVRYSIGGNMQAFNNELVKFGEREIGSVTIKEEGHPYNGWFMLEWAGIFQSQQEIDNSAVQNPAPQPGDLKYKDQNGDGVINDQDRVHIDGAFPDFTYNFNVSLDWRSVDFSARFYGSQGGKKFLYYQGASPFYKGTPPSTKWRNRWTEDNPTNKMPRIYAGEDHAQIFNSKSTYFLKDASYLRLQNVQLGYTLPTSLVNKIGLKSMRVYYAGDNVLTFSKMDDYDPERSYKSGTMANYPQNKVHSLGVTINF